MLRKLSLVAMLIWLSPAFGLGLGEINVTSHLNQPLVATIPISSAKAGELDSLVVRIASAEAFTRAGIDYADYLATLSFEIVTEGGAPRVLIRSRQPAREPFLSFLLEARWQGGRLLREYTALLDPPGVIAAPQPQAPSQRRPATPGAQPAPQTAPSTTPGSDYYETAEEQAAREAQPSSAEPAPMDSASAEAGGGTYGPVGSQETLWSIATRLRPSPSITMDQMLVALFEANPQAFDGGLNGLRKGSTLRVPSVDEIRSVDQSTARTRVNQARSGGVTRAPRREPRTQTARPAPPADPVPVPEPEPQLAEAPAPEPKPAPTPPPAPVPSKPSSALSQLQELAQKPAPPAPAPEPEPEPEPTVAAAPEPATTPPPPPPPPSEATIQPPSGMVDEPPPVTAQPTPGALVEEETALAPPPEPEPAPAPIPVATPPPDEGGSFFDKLPILPIAAALLLILAGVGGYLYWKKRQDEADAAPEPSMATVASRPAPRLQAPDDLDFTAPPAPKAQAAPAARPAPPPPPPLPESTVTLRKPVAPDATGAMTSTMSLERAMATAHLEPEGPGSATEAMPRLDQTLAGREPPAEATGAPGKVDFDVTGNYAAETMSINLDANDPVSEADFHLAYGLYDEAALLLQQAVKKDPNRPDIRIKLAETYLLASKPAEFLKASEELKPMAKAEDWQKVVIMGQQLCPDAPIFRDTDAAGLGGGVDLVFGEPAAAEATPAGRQESAGALDFNLEDFQMPQAEKAAAPAPAKPAGGDNVLEFDLAQFDLGTPAQASALSTPAAAAPAPAATGGFDLELKDFDLGGTMAPAATSTRSAGSAPPESGGMEFDLGGGGDDPATKLDLARAYLEMGDKNEARTLLNDVVKAGSSQQKKEAQDLLQRVSA